MAMWHKNKYQSGVFGFLCTLWIGINHARAEKSSIYSPMGKRDPFRQPLNDANQEVASTNPLEKWGVERLELKAILKGIGRPRAMFEDPDGKSFIVSEGDVIGRERGKISRILNKEVIITERTFNYLGTQSLYERVLSLPNDETSGESISANGKNVSPVPMSAMEPVGRKTITKSSAEMPKDSSGDSANTQSVKPLGPAGLNVNSSNIK